MEERAGRTRQSLLPKVEFVKVVPDNFQKFWDETPEDLRKFVETLGQNKKDEIFGMASVRINESKILSVNEVRLKDTLNATIAGEVYAVIDNVKDANKFYRESLDLLREDKIRESKKT